MLSGPRRSVRDVGTAAQHQPIPESLCRYRDRGGVPIRRHLIRRLV
jgi:hypothetical protein